MLACKASSLTNDTKSGCLDKLSCECVNGHYLITCSHLVKVIVASGHLPGYRVISVLAPLTEVSTLATSSVCHMYYRLQNDARVSLKFRLIWFLKRLLRKKKFFFQPEDMFVCDMEENELCSPPPA